jgi:hypothetical protein
MTHFPDDIGGYRKLLSAVLWLAVYDACAQPTKPSKENKQFPTDNANSAIRFIFEDNERFFFKQYMRCLDMDPEAFRNRLVGLMYGGASLEDPPFNSLPHNARKSFCFNHTHWLTYARR